MTRLLAAVPLGWTRVVVDGRAWGLRRTDHAGGRTVTLEAEELGGRDAIGANVLRTARGDLLKPCEMPAAKVMDFLSSVAGDPR